MRLFQCKEARRVSPSSPRHGGLPGLEGHRRQLAQGTRHDGSLPMRSYSEERHAPCCSLTSPPRQLGPPPAVDGVSLANHGKTDFTTKGYRPKAE